jgi:hypothetical protein
LSFVGNDVNHVSEWVNGGGLVSSQDGVVSCGGQVDGGDEISSVSDGSEGLDLGIVDSVGHFYVGNQIVLFVIISAVKEGDGVSGQIEWVDIDGDELGSGNDRKVA